MMIRSETEKKKVLHEIPILSYELQVCPHYKKIHFPLKLKS